MCHILKLHKNLPRVFFVPSQNLTLDLPLFMLFVIVSSLVKKGQKRNDQYDKVRTAGQMDRSGWSKGFVRATMRATTGITLERVKE